MPLGRFGIGWLDSSIYNGNYTPPTCRAAGPDSPLATSPTFDEVGKLTVFGSYHAAKEHMEQAVAQNPGLAGTMHVVPDFEINTAA